MCELQVVQASGAGWETSGISPFARHAHSHARTLNLFCFFPTEFRRKKTVRSLHVRRVGVRGMNNFKTKAHKLAINKVQTDICVIKYKKSALTFASKGYFNQFWAYFQDNIHYH